jgi:hypothetical protein
VKRERDFSRHCFASRNTLECAIEIAQDSSPIRQPPHYSSQALCHVTVVDAADGFETTPRDDVFRAAKQCAWTPQRAALTLSRYSIDNTPLWGVACVSQLESPRDQQTQANHQYRQLPQNHQ